MTPYITAKYLHLLAILMLFCTCLIEYRMLAREVRRATLKRLASVDLLFGLAALLVLLSGLSMALWFAKPLGYYLDNGLFHLKFGLFILIGLISAYPTLFFFRHRKGDPDESVALPLALIWIVRLELLGILILPLLGILIASGASA